MTPIPSRRQLPHSLDPESGQLVIELDLYTLDSRERWFLAIEGGQVWLWNGPAAAEETRRKPIVVYEIHGDRLVPGGVH